MQPTWRKLYCLSAGRKSCFVHVFLEILQRYANFLFWIIWACLATHTQNDRTTCREPLCLSVYQKLTLSFTLFLRYYISKNPAIWLANSILACNSKTKFSPGIGREISVTILAFILDLFSGKTNKKMFQKI